MLGFPAGDRFISCDSLVVTKLRGVATLDEPEHRLWFGVLEQAIRDLFSTDSGIQSSAERWVFSDGLDSVAEALGLSAEKIRTSILDITEASMA